MGHASEGSIGRRKAGRVASRSRRARACRNARRGGGRARAPPVLAHASRALGQRSAADGIASGITLDSAVRRRSRVARSHRSALIVHVRTVSVARRSHQTRFLATIAYARRSLSLNSRGTGDSSAALLAARAPRIALDRRIRPIASSRRPSTMPALLVSFVRHGSVIAQPFTI